MIDYRLIKKQIKKRGQLKQFRIKIMATYSVKLSSSEQIIDLLKFTNKKKAISFASYCTKDKDLKWQYELSENFKWVIEVTDEELNTIYEREYKLI